MGRIKGSKESFILGNSKPTIKVQFSEDKYCGFDCFLRGLREEGKGICLYNIGEFNVGLSSE